MCIVIFSPPVQNLGFTEEFNTNIISYDLTRNSQKTILEV
jgi:hypothetical protein